MIIQNFWGKQENIQFKILHFRKPTWNRNTLNALFHASKNSQQ